MLRKTNFYLIEAKQMFLSKQIVPNIYWKSLKKIFIFEMGDILQQEMVGSYHLPYIYIGVLKG